MSQSSRNDEVLAHPIGGRNAMGDMTQASRHGLEVWLTTGALAISAAGSFGHLTGKARDMFGSPSAAPRLDLPPIIWNGEQSLAIRLCLERLRPKKVNVTKAKLCSRDKCLRP
jgi:hypothetical protein